MFFTLNRIKCLKMHARKKDTWNEICGKLEVTGSVNKIKYFWNDSTMCKFVLVKLYIYYKFA